MTPVTNDILLHTSSWICSDVLRGSESSRAPFLLSSLYNDEDFHNIFSFQHFSAVRGLVLVTYYFEV